MVADGGWMLIVNADQQVAFIIKAVQVIYAVLTFEAFKEENCVY